MYVFIEGIPISCISLFVGVVWYVTTAHAGGQEITVRVNCIVSLVPEKIKPGSQATARFPPPQELMCH